MKERRSWQHPSVIRFLKEKGSDDPITAIRQVARDLVSQAFDAGWTGPPFDPLTLAALLQIDVLPNDAISEAQLVPVPGGKARIEYNPHERPTRIRFSLSHEIGHTLFSDCEQAVRQRLQKKNPNSWELEFLCDIAASEILLPYGVFVQDAKQVAPRMRQLMALAETYRASLEAALLRFAETSERSCSVIVARFNDPAQTKLSVQYSKSSPTFNQIIATDYEIPRASIAYECVNPGWTSHATEQWNIFNADCEIECVGLPAIKYDSRPRVGIVISSAEASVEWSMYEFGDATRPRGSGMKLIGQLVNNGAALGTGFGRAMAEAWPESAIALRRWKDEKLTFELGNSQLVKLSDNVYVLQMLAQRGVSSKPGRPAIRYSHLGKCLAEMARTAIELKASVHMPRIGAGQAGGDWNIIEGMIIEELIARRIDVTIYDLPGRPMPKPAAPQPELFKLF